MNNKIQEGKVLTLTAPYAVASGAGALVGSIFCVATSAVASGAQGEFEREGVFELAKVSAQAWTLGAKIYWDNSAKNCTTTSSGNTLIGAAAAVAADPTSTGYVLLDGTVR